MGPLQGLRVLDLSLHLAGPYASAILADMGAEVIRIERPGGDEDRRLGYQLLNDDAAVFLSRARNKKSLTLNLRSPEGMEILRQLVKKADILLENYGPVTRQGLGIDYESLKQLNSRLIMASVSGYGSWGPRKDKTAFDPIAQAASSAMSLSGFPDDERPARAALTWVDYSAALHAAVGILLALWHREKTGKGQHIDVSLYDTAVSLVGMSGIFTEYLLFGYERKRMGNASPLVYGDTFRAKDGWIFIHLGRNANWQRFTRLIGKEELGSDPRFNSDAKRVENRGLIDEIVKSWVANKTVDEIVNAMEGSRIPYQKVNSIPEAVAEPQLKAREMLIDVDYPDKGKVPTSGIVIKLSESPGEIKSGAPSLGEHNHEILSNLLGYDQEAISKLEQKGIV